MRGRGGRDAAAANATGRAGVGRALGQRRGVCGVCARRSRGAPPPSPQPRLPVLLRPLHARPRTGRSCGRRCRRSPERAEPAAPIRLRSRMDSMLHPRPPLGRDGDHRAFKRASESLPRSRSCGRRAPHWWAGPVLQSLPSGRFPDSRPGLRPRRRRPGCWTPPCVMGTQRPRSPAGHRELQLERITIGGSCWG